MPNHHTLDELERIDPDAGLRAKATLAKRSNALINLAASEMCDLPEDLPTDIYVPIPDSSPEDYVKQVHNNPSTPQDPYSSRLQEEDDILKEFGL